MQIQRHLLAAATALSLCAPAFATAVISTSDSSMTNTSGWGEIGQTFTATSSENLLQDWTFNLAERAGGGNVLFSIFEWTGSDVGATLFSQTLAWNEAGGSLSVLNMNVSLVTDHTYVAVVDLLGYSGASVGYTEDLYSGGNGAWNNGSWYSFASLDTVFQARFGASTAADAAANGVPEPTSFALFGIAALGLVLTTRRHRRPAGV